MIDPQVLRDAFDAIEKNNLDAYLQKFDEQKKEEIRRIVVSDILRPVTRGFIIEEIPIVQPTMPKENVTWDAHKKWLMQKVSSSTFPLDAVIELESSTSKISNILANPNSDKIYGLVVGHVQSGKTAHFTGVIARAADLGYTFVIVLSGILNDLRMQTQIRLIKDIIGDHPNIHSGLDYSETIPIHDRPYFQLLTSSERDGDIKKATKEALPNWLTEAPKDKQILIAVVKKNVSVLEHLFRGITRTKDSVKELHKVLIIDDEADHATVNTAGDGDNFYHSEVFDMMDEVEDDDFLEKETDPSKTNMLVRKIINQFPKSTYIGYTATPFANVLIPDKKLIEDEGLGPSLYPRDFIQSLSCPKEYFGPHKLFSDFDSDPESLDFDRSYDFLIPVSSSQIDDFSKIYNQEEINDMIEDLAPKSLKKSIIHFILTGIIRQYRRDVGIKMNKHHTMLIHITRLNDEQKKITDIVKNLLDIWRDRLIEGFGDNSKKLRQNLRLEWEKSFSECNESWEDIERFIYDKGEDWLESIEVLMINSESDEDLNYGELPRNIIAIGGNKLSRGLTLEGLCVSYFLRHTRNYDTLMQMGRWFGYRQGYEDLVRLHSTNDLFRWFSWLVEVENHVRADIERYHILGKKPSELSIRIPLHREMRPTSSNKMKSAVVRIGSYDGLSASSIRPPINDQERLEHNFRKVTNFLNSIPNENLSFPEEGKFSYWNLVDKELISNFLKSLDFDGPPIATFDTNSISKYISESDDIEQFTVCHFGNEYSEVDNVPSSEPSYSQNIRWPVTKRFVARSQLKDNDGGLTGDLRGISDPSHVNKITKLIDTNTPIIFIYLIAPGSKPRNENKGNRAELPDLGVPILGLRIQFPNFSMNNEINKYVHVKDIMGDI
jgi:hypothetical protein